MSWPEITQIKSNSEINIKRHDLYRGTNLEYEYSSLTRPEAESLVGELDFENYLRPDISLIVNCENPCAGEARVHHEVATISTSSTRFPLCVVTETELTDLPEQPIPGVCLLVPRRVALVLIDRDWPFGSFAYFKPNDHRFDHQGYEYDIIMPDLIPKSLRPQPWSVDFKKLRFTNNTGDPIEISRAKPKHTLEAFLQAEVIGEREFTLQPNGSDQPSTAKVKIRRTVSITTYGPPIRPHRNICCLLEQTGRVAPRLAAVGWPQFSYGMHVKVFGERRFGLANCVFMPARCGDIYAVFPWRSDNGY